MTFKVVAIGGLFWKEPFFLSTSSTPFCSTPTSCLYNAWERKEAHDPKITPYRGKEQHKKEDEREKKVQKILPFEGKA